jgi:hypothetical protein
MPSGGIIDRDVVMNEGRRRLPGRSGGALGLGWRLAPWGLGAGGPVFCHDPVFAHEISRGAIERAIVRIPSLSNPWRLRLGVSSSRLHSIALCPIMVFRYLPPRDCSSQFRDCGTIAL